MKILPLAVIVLAIAANSAAAGPRPGVRLVVDQLTGPPQKHEQLAETPDNGQDNNAVKPPPTTPSDRLAHQKGVIHPPPSHDPAVIKPPNDTTGKSVISPPGTPGGDQEVQPK